MARDDDEDELETTMASGSVPAVDPSKELEAILDDLEVVLKNGDVVAVLSGKGVNASLVLLASSGMRALLANRKQEAIEDFSTLAEELAARMAATNDARPKRSKNGRGER
jgi:hypothetical protein